MSTTMLQGKYVGLKQEEKNPASANTPEIVLTAREESIGSEILSFCLI